MKVSKILAGLALGTSLLFASSALASDHGSLQLYQRVDVNGTQLAPGHYKVEWSGTNKNTDVKILKGKSVVVSAQAKIIPSVVQQDNGYTTTKTTSGEDDLTGVFFGGKNWTLQLKNASTSPAARSASRSGV